MMHSENTQHAKLSPSSSDIWLNCPGSLINQPEEDASEYALEGTAAHSLGEHCLKNNIDAHTAPKHPDWEQFDSPEMRTHVQTYLDYVRRHITAGAELFIEQRLEIMPLLGVWGTADAVIVTPEGVLHCHDLKFGKGVLVEADSTQLLLYAIGTLTFDWLSKVPVTHVVVHIVQPRRDNIVSKTYSVEELAAWVVKNKHLVERAYAESAIYSSGTHCKWCKKRATCVERAKANLALAQFDFDDFEPTCATYEGMTEEALVKVFLNIKLIRDYLDDVEAEVAKRAHERHVDGVKWVAGRVARKITNFDDAAARLRSAGIEPFKPAPFIGITDIEKELKARGLKFVDTLKGCFEVIAGKPALVPESDKRDALTPEASAQDDFK